MSWLNLTTFQIDFSKEGFDKLPSWIKEVKQRITKSGQKEKFEPCWEIVTFKGVKCLTNKIIEDDDRVDCLIYFALSKKIKCTIEYYIDSESYDKFVVWAGTDGQENKLDKGGQSDGFQKLTFDVFKSTPHIQFGYIKDSSSSDYTDRVYIKSITFENLPPNTEVRWLIKENNKYMSYVDKKWINIEATSSADTICKTCAKEPPPADVLGQLQNPEIIKWTKDIIPNAPKQFDFTAIPKAILVTQKTETNFDYPYITGINKVTIACDITGKADIKFAFSVDNGVSWKTYTNNAWKNISLNVIDIISSGMDIQTVQGLTQNNWSELLGNSRKIKFACVVTTQSSKDNLKLRQVYYKYITEGVV